MSTTETVGRHHEVSEMLDTFVDIEVGDTLQVTVDDTSIDGEVSAIDRADRRFTVLVETFASDYLRVETQWAGGWLDPQVDRLKPHAEERQPLGELRAVELV